MRPISSAGHSRQNPLRAGKFGLDRGDRNPAFADTEKCPKITIASRFKDDSYAEVTVDDSLTRLKLNPSVHRPNLCDAEMEEAGRFAAFPDNNFLRIFVGFAPEDAAKIEFVASMGCLAKPNNSVRGRIDP